MRTGIVTAVMALSMGLSLHGADAKPLKVFILCGQSNMEGHAQTRTFPAVAADPRTKAIYDVMVDAEGNPVVCENVWISYAYGNFSGDPIGRKAGNLTAGWGSQHHVGTGKIGPEFTFGIYMQKLLGEPILIIKNAWGGKSLMVDFRPPSAGALPDTASGKERASAGQYYQHMIDHVKNVLADPRQVYPAYDPKAGYEIAGFVWFQGFNDLVGDYPRMDPSQGKKGVKDYSEYSRLLACFIRDVRKELSAPDMPFVTGVLGTGGKDASENTVAFRKAMAAPAEMPAFKGNVINVFSEAYWPSEIDAVQEKIAPIHSEAHKQRKALDKLELSRTERKKHIDTINAEARKQIEAILSEDELFVLDHGTSNFGFHYHGSAKFFAQLGKAFAEALLAR